MQEDYTLEVCYLGMSDLEMDANIRENLPEFMNRVNEGDLEVKWSYQESDYGDLPFRVHGFTTNRSLNEFEKITLHLQLVEEFGGDVFIFSA